MPGRDGCSMAGSQPELYKGVWGCVTERDESVRGSEECEGSWKPVLYFGIHLLRTLVKTIGKSNDPCGSPQVLSR
jgi:hypothetical protein